jgi:hypothetical protein
MCIYDIQVLSERTIQNFIPTRLAIKELAGKLYFCKSISDNIENYGGSGVIWKKRIKKYGKENIKTLWVSDWYHSPHEIQEIALHFSKENQIVESDRWANLKPENGLDGGRQTPDIIEKIASKHRGKKSSMEHRRASGIALKKVWADEAYRNKMIAIQKASHNTVEMKIKKSSVGKICQNTEEAKKRRAKQVGSNAANYDNTVYHFAHKSGLIEVMPRLSLIQKHNVNPGNLTLMISGKRSSVNGWSLIPSDR